METMRRVVSAEFLRGFQNRDEFFEKLGSEQDVWRTIGDELVLLFLFSGVYGIVMGSYNGFLQAISSGIKVPLLFVLTVLIAFPAFFILQHALGSRLGFWQMLKIILAGFVMLVLVMASFAPIVIFFLITGGNYSFLKLLHVAIFGLAGFFGMKMVLDGLKFCCEKKAVYPKTGVVVFRFWIVLLAFVGMQLAWNLRPFIGSRALPFEFVRSREGNFYVAVIDAASDLVLREARSTPEKPSIDSVPDEEANLAEEDDPREK
jgi:hypothetical protein